ncbi:MAG: hypothetical protein KJ893_10920 [Candidatus Omnitrophica bacterium]|nr:hypothetical protein [Candidatus Omnitrophota bacterium]MBU4479732.1 hypothetical protein [Candidatus Omnitrophota bacterium]
MKQDFYSKVKEIDTALSVDQVNPDLAKSIMLLISDDESLRDYFFKRVKSIQWVDILEREKYFSVNNILFDSNGNAYFWVVLNYLERVSEQLFQGPKYGKKLIEIIDSIVEYSLNKRKINHYHIWWYCAKILNNLLDTVIKDNLTVDKFQTWLSVWTDHSMGSDLAISDIGEKLLPKFLHDDFGPDYIYAENIVYAITAIRAGGKSNPITKRDDAVMAWQTFWIRNAFKKHGQLIGQKCPLRVVFEIANRLRKALEYKQKDYYRDLEIEDAVYRLKVARVFADGLKPGEIKFKDDEYECVIKQFSNEQLKGVDRENDFWKIYNLEPQIDRGCFAFTALTKDAFAAEIKHKLPKGINWQGADKLEQNILNVHEGLYSDYSHIWCRTLKSGPEHDNGAEDVLTLILRDVLLAKCEVNREAGKQVSRSFLKDNKYQFPIFRRFVLLCIDKFWTEYSGLLDEFIEVVPEVLEESDFEVEMQDVLKNHNSTFSPASKAKLKALINNVPEYYANNDDKKLAAYWRYTWLSPLREDPVFSSLYEEAIRKAEIKDAKPYAPERSSFEGGGVGHKSPLLKEDILQKPIAEIVKYLIEFKGADFWHGTFEGEPDKEGLADILQAAVKDDPKKFTAELCAFMDTDYFYLHRILRGLEEAWNAGLEIDWNNIFDFSIEYLGRGKDTAVKTQGEDSAKIRIVEAIAALIGDGARDDARAFAPQYFDKAERIFDLMLPLLKGEKNPDTQRDALTYALNTTLGRTIKAYVSFSLRVARSTQKERGNWGQDKFERFLSFGIDGYIWFGCYLPQMKYLDSKYTLEKINYFAQKDAADLEWQMFMEGYLTGSRIYKDLYGLMRPNYITALQSTVFKGRADERLVEHICIGYLQLGEALAKNNEDGRPSLFWKMLDEADTDDKRSRWEEVAGFFWSISGKSLKKEEKEDQEEPSEESKKKVVFFWEWTFNKQDFVKKKLGDLYGAFLSRMAELTIWLDKIDKTTEKWLLLSAPYVEIQHSSAFFIEYLTKFEDEESVKRIGKIFLKILETSTPTFRQEDIRLIVERLYKAGEKHAAIKADADNICNTYGRSGIHFLKDLFFKNQKTA